MIQFLDQFEDKNLWDEYKIVIQTGTAELLELPERKEILSNDWREENGMEYDLDLPRFKDREVTLSCAFICDSDIDFWTCYENFWDVLKTSGWKNLFINDHSKTYEVFYKKSDNWKKGSKRLKDVTKVFVKFQITFQVKYQ